MIERYKTVLRKPSQHSPQLPTAFVPNYEDLDYEKGYVDRYFCQRSNDTSAPIMEISSTEYSKKKENPYFITVSLKWRISGPPGPKSIGIGVRDDIGVRASNRESIKLKSDVMPNLKLYLPNLLQFHESTRP